MGISVSTLKPEKNERKVKIINNELKGRDIQ